MAEIKEELKSLLMKVKEESKNVGLKLSTQKTKIRAPWSHHFMVNRWGNMETMTDFILFGSKITADGDSFNEIKKRLFLGKKSYDKPRQHIKK